MPMIRYAEILLIAAEGLARTGQESEARGYLNQVRKRAGLADETASGDALVQAILTERFHEFPLEFKIWDDIRRTRLYPEADGMNSGKLKWTPLSTAVIQNKPEGQTKPGAIPEHALLWPVPLGEMQANPAIAGQQNTGWN
ncbi:MAG: RagB/SusD family nutrient uptake outer membrane protein [Niabella sp.]